MTALMAPAAPWVIKSLSLDINGRRRCRRLDKIPTLSYTGATVAVPASSQRAG